MSGDFGMSFITIIVIQIRSGLLIRGNPAELKCAFQRSALFAVIFSLSFPAGSDVDSL